jgi:hypothetical protein
MAEQNKQPELTPEQKAEMEKWEAFKKDLEDNPNSPATKGDLLEVMNAIFGDMQGVAGIAAQAMKNTQALHQMIQPILQVFGAPGGPNRTKSGIIMP